MGKRGTQFRGGVEPGATASAEPQAAPVAIQERFELIEVARLIESPSNPRRHFDEAKIREYAESMKQVGVIQNLRVRTHPHHKPGCETIYEIVCGACRFRAAKLAKLRHVPCMVQELDDTAALQYQIIENLHRNDVHPLDEADGFARLIHAGIPIEQIAGKVHKSETYIRQRLVLNKLNETAKKLIWDGKISAAHGIHLARLRPDDQVAAIKALKQWNGEYATAADLAEWIAREVHLCLSGAPWKKDDATLGAPACLSCEKRSGHCPALFADIGTKDMCLDRECFHRKQAAFVDRKGQELPPDAIRVSSSWNARSLPKGVIKRGDYVESTKGNKDSKPALIVDGEHAGKTVYVEVCVSKAMRGDSESAKREQERERRKRQMERAQTTAILLATLEALPLPADAACWRLIAAKLFERMHSDAKRAYFKAMCIPTEKPSDKKQADTWSVDRAAVESCGDDADRLERLAIGALMANALGEYDYSSSKEILKELADRYEVDVAGVSECATAQFNAAHPIKESKPDAKYKSRK